MQRDLSLKTAFYQARHKRYKTWQKIVMVLASVVVFCTTYALILPAITMEQEVVCGLDEHLHIETCYKVPDAVEQVTLVCKEENLNLHVHSENCSNEFGEIICGYADFVLHSHTDSCFDQAGHQVCPLEEIEAHLHDNNCYEQLHSHGEACYTPKQGALLCAMSDIDPHTHTEDCFVPVQKLNCDLPETEGHSHTDACYPRGETLICGQDAVETHAHAEDCLDENGFVVCGLEVTEGHDHVETCYALAAEPSCGMEVTEGHTHAEGCYQTENEKVCPLEEGQIHIHEDACYEWLPQLTCEIPLPAEDAEPILICEESQRMIHTHDAACYDAGGLLACGMMQLTEHIHGDTCFIIQQVQPEGLVLSCGLDEHTHTETCYPVQDAPENGLMPDDSQLDIRNCGVAAHSHLESCYAEDGALMCTMTEHAHWELCDLAPADTTAVESEEAWYADVPTLTDDMAADLITVAESQIGYEQSDINYIVTEDEEILYYSRYADWWSYGEKPYGDWNAKFVAFCLDTAGIPSSIVPVEPETAAWPDTLAYYDLWYDNDGEFAPIAADLVFFDTDNDGEADRAGIITVVNEAEGTFDAVLERRGMVQQVTYDLDDSDIMGYARIPGNEPAQVEAVLTEAAQSVIDQIDVLPTYEEYVDQLNAYYDADDLEGEEAYATAMSQQIKAVYEAYTFLTPEEKAAVYNADKLMSLETVWSAKTLVDSNTYEIMEVNSYTSDQTGAFIVRGGRGSTVAQSGVQHGRDFEWWYAIVVRLEDGQYRVKEVNPPQEGLSKMNVYAPYDGFVLMLHADTIGKSVNVSVGDYVYMNGNFWRHTTAYTGEALGTVTFYDEPVSYVTPFWHEPTLVTNNIADTNEFIDLNLYDYGSNINTKFQTETYTYGGYSGVTLWPGFQWNGGAYNLNGSYHRHQVDYIDFGNSLITDLEYETKILSASYDYAKSANAVSVGKTYNYEYAEPETTGIINRLWRDGTNWSSITNRPIGMSMNTSVTTTSEANFDVLKPILSPYGYPVVLASDEVDDFTGVLDYLFTDNTYADKVNDSTINGLFQINPTTGEYFFNSRWNHAQYDSDSNTFDLYEEVITPNFIIYPFGNFLPFNTITDGLTSANIKDIEAGTLKNYLAEEVSQKLSYSDSSESQLRTMLSMYRSSLNPDTVGSAWHTYSGLDAIRDYFWGDGSTDSDGDANDDKPSIHTSDIGELVENGDLYNIDFDVQTDFFFGMDMSMRFYQPKDGLTGNDNGNNSNGTWSTVATAPTYRKSSLYVEEDTQILSGSPDGIPDYPMKFYFTGDDDVWVYLDGMLFLDLTGIHRHVGGEIDFQKGVVNYYELDVANTGDISKTPYRTFTFTELVTKAIKFRNRYSSLTDAQLTAAVNEIINPATGRFYDYSTHTFKFFYMERGSGSSVCRINFNFPLLRQNTLSVQKELTNDSEVVGSPDFMFQVLGVDGSGNKTNTPFLPGDWAYSLYNADGSVVQEIKVNSKYPDGRVEEMVIKDAQGNVLCTEIYDANGNRTSQEGANKDKVLRLGENGIFTLKAGQRAEFVGIPESWGKYYVRELLDNLDKEQYESITVSGEAADKSTVTVGGGTFQGADSPILDMTNGSSTFRFDNKINLNKSGKLSVTKNIQTYVAPNADTLYKMYVELGDIPLKANTAYTVAKPGGTSETRYATEDHCIEIAAGETATFTNVLAGTRFLIQETEQSAKGFVVTYTATNGETTVENGAITGVVHASTQVAVTVINAETGAPVKIPVTKTLAKPDGNTHTYTFKVERVEVNFDSNTITCVEDVPLESGGSVTITEAPVTTELAFNIKKVDILGADDFPAKFYYRITEEAATDSLVNSQIYLAEVTVSDNPGSTDPTQCVATVTKVWSVTTEGGGLAFAEQDNNAITFENVLVGDLKLSKTVSGIDTTQGFNFTVELSEGTSGVPIAGSYPATVYSLDRTEDQDNPYTTAIVFTDGKTTLTDVKSGEYVIFHNIPIGTQWTITETSTSGYTVTYNITVGETTTPVTDPEPEATVSGSIVAGGTAVECVNTIGYELPETGASGRGEKLLICGVAMMAGAVMCVCLRKRYRGRRVTGG